MINAAIRRVAVLTARSTVARSEDPVVVTAEDIILAVTAASIHAVVAQENAARREAAQAEEDLALEEAQAEEPQLTNLILALVDHPEELQEELQERLREEHQGEQPDQEDQ